MSEGTQAVAVPLAETIAGAQPRAVLGVRQVRGQWVLDVAAEHLVELALVLRDDPRFRFEMLCDLCGVDWPERTPRFEVVIHLLSTALNQRVRLHVPCAEGDSVPSLVDVWPAAGWFEREAWDLYGIAFPGNPDLRRLLTDYGFDGHPLRKDFPLMGEVELRYDEEQKRCVYERVQLAQDFRSFDFVSPWEGILRLPGDEKAQMPDAKKAGG